MMLVQHFKPPSDCFSDTNSDLQSTIAALYTHISLQHPQTQHPASSYLVPSPPHA